MRAKKMEMKRLAGSQRLLNEVCRQFKKRGGSLSRWCRANGITQSNANVYLSGKRNGPKALEWRWRIVEAAYEGDHYWKIVWRLRGLIDDLEEEISEKVNQPQFKGKGINPMCIPSVRNLTRMTIELKKIIWD